MMNILDSNLKYTIKLKERDTGSKFLTAHHFDGEMMGRHKFRSGLCFRYVMVYFNC